MTDVLVTPSGTKEVVAEIKEVLDDWELDPISLHLKRLKSQKDDIKAEIAQIKQYPIEDPYENGTTIIWHVENSGGYLAHQAAVREGDRWYVTGELRAFTWGSLVVEHLTAFRGTEVEIIHPIEEVEPLAELGTN